MRGEENSRLCKVDSSGPRLRPIHSDYPSRLGAAVQRKKAKESAKAGKASTAEPKNNASSPQSRWPEVQRRIKMHGSGSGSSSSSGRSSQSTSISARRMRRRGSSSSAKCCRCCAAEDHRLGLYMPSKGAIMPIIWKEPTGQVSATPTPGWAMTRGRRTARSLPSIDKGAYPAYRGRRGLRVPAARGSTSKSMGQAVTWR